MKTLQIIKEEYAKEVGFENWEQLLKKLNLAVYAQHDNDIVTRRFAIEVAKKALINASETALVIEGDCGEFGTYRPPFVYKKSILNESNIPKL